MFAALGLLNANAKIQAQWFNEWPAQPVIVLPADRYVAIDIRNESGEPISLSVRGIHVTDIPAGGKARVRAIAGDIEMSAFKQVSKLSTRQLIHEHRDFIWTVPLRQRVFKNPALPPDAYLESETFAPTKVPQAAEPKTPQAAQTAPPKLELEQVVRPKATDNDSRAQRDPRRAQN